MTRPVRYTQFVTDSGDCGSVFELRADAAIGQHAATRINGGVIKVPGNLVQIRPQRRDVGLSAQRAILSKARFPGPIRCLKG